MFQEEIDKGFSWLIDIHNDDGGWPAGTKGDKSGLWTTGDVLNTLFESSWPYHTDLIHQSIKFIVDNQNDDGGWPWISSDHSFIPATSDCIKALILSLRYIKDDTFNKKINSSIKKALKWIIESRNEEDGGWGLNLADKSNMIGTYYALMALSKGRNHFSVDDAKQEGIKNLCDIQNEDGSFGFEKGDEGDISNTSRAIIALKECGFGKSKEKKINSALNFIKTELSNPQMLDEISEDCVVRSEGPQYITGYILRDSLYALLMCNHFDNITLNALLKIIDSQCFARKFIFVHSTS